MCRSDPHAMCPFNVDRPRIPGSYRRKVRVLSVVRPSNLSVVVLWCFMIYSSSFCISSPHDVIGVFQTHGSGVDDRTSWPTSVGTGDGMNARFFFFLVNTLGSEFQFFLKHGELLKFSRKQVDNTDNCDRACQ